MINSVNGLDFLKPKLTMDKYNSNTTTKLLPHSSITQPRKYATVSGHQNNDIDSLQEKQTKFLLNDEINQQDRVKVQHLENHSKLQNNKCWNNFRTLYNINSSLNVRDMVQTNQTKNDNETDIPNVEHLPSATVMSLNIQDKSAFNLDLNNYHNNSRFGGNNNCDNSKEEHSSKATETNNNYTYYCKKYNNYGLINKQSPTTTMIVMSTEPQPPTAANLKDKWFISSKQSDSYSVRNDQTRGSCLNLKFVSQGMTFDNSRAVTAISTDSQRTEDQNNAYRHIESVHNYAKSKSFEGDDDKTSTNNSRHSSYLDDDEDDDEENEDDDPEYDNDEDIDYEDRLHDDLDASYEDVFSKQRYRRLQNLSNSPDVALSNNRNNMMSSRGTIVELTKSTNFLNILKDHKIQPIKVNDKIKTCSEDEEAQIDVDVETVESQPVPNSLMETNGIYDESTACVKPDHHARRPMNAFLIFCKRHRAIVKERYKNLENRAITKILGDWWASLDTSDKKCFTNLAQQNKDAFFSANPNFKWYKLPAPPLRTLTTRPASIFGQDCQDDNEANLKSNITRNNRDNYFKLADEAQMGDLSQLIQGNSEVLEENHLKRRFYNENSFSSNSSEEDIEPKKKSARSCKGKRYQELINSGQIPTALKKSKSSARSVCGDSGANNEVTEIKQNLRNVINFNNNFSNNVYQKNFLSESENVISFDLNGFDLEERIKDLPALNLDDYLQRKRNTKKKKKFSSNGKKKGQRCNNVSSINDNLTANKLQKPQLTTLSNESQHQMVKQHQQVATAVGSQKRKARKESITRRDVSAIEQEVASLLPLTINGCCYFQEAPKAIKYKTAIEKDTAENSAINVTSVAPIIPFKQNSPSVSIEILNNTNVCNNINLNDNISSSTSDLLILAEVAANRTELKH